MKAYSVLRNFKTKTGAILQTTVRWYETEAAAQEACQRFQAEFDLMLDMLLVHRGEDGGGKVVGRLLEFMHDLGFVGVVHGVAWAEVSDSAIVMSEKSPIILSS